MAFRKIKRPDAPPDSLDGVPAFHDRPPWWGGDLQTLRNRLVVNAAPVPGHAEPVRIPARDGSGDVLTGTLHRPDRGPVGPLVLLVHGLTGSEDSDYVRISARFHLACGRRVLRLNLRGAGSSRATCGGFYHAGRGEDLDDVLNGLDVGFTADGVFAIGYSLGGNILLNLMGRVLPGRRHAVVGAATVSAPIRPAESARRILACRNRVYHHALLADMKRESLSPHAALSPTERCAIRAARTVVDFDDRFIAPRHGFAGAEDYYDKTAGIAFAPRIDRPTLLIHAANDPIIPTKAYTELVAARPPAVSVVIAPSGGHVGFHAADSPIPWHDRAIDAFLVRHGWAQSGRGRS